MLSRERASGREGEQEPLHLGHGRWLSCSNSPLKNQALPPCAPRCRKGPGPAAGPLGLSLQAGSYVLVSPEPAWPGLAMARPQPGPEAPQSRREGSRGHSPMAMPTERSLGHASKQPWGLFSKRRAGVVCVQLPHPRPCRSTPQGQGRMQAGEEKGSGCSRGSPAPGPSSAKFQLRQRQKDL